MRFVIKLKTNGSIQPLQTVQRMHSLSNSRANPDGKQDVHQAVQPVPLSTNTCTWRIEAIANQVNESFIDNLNRCESFPVAVDGRTDINRVAQLSVFVRYYLNGRCSENLAAVIPLTERTTGEDIYQAFKAYMEFHKVPMHKRISVVIDGTPAMVGVYSGFIKHLKDSNPQILKSSNSQIAFHCIDPRKHFPRTIERWLWKSYAWHNETDSFLRPKSSLQHLQLREFLQEADSKYNELLPHSNVHLVTQCCVWIIVDIIIFITFMMW